MKNFENLPNEQWVDLVLDDFVGSKKYAVSSHGRVVCYNSLLNNGRLISAPKDGKVADFKITDGKLYLFYNAAHKLSSTKFNSIEPWNKDEANLIKKGNENWKKLKKK